MDVAFNDPSYKEARTIINNHQVVKLTVEDKIDYDRFFASTHIDRFYRRDSFEQIIDNIEDLRIFAKYINRIGMTITKVDIVE